MFFASLPFFLGVDTAFLVPLATNIEVKTYQMGDVVLKSGEKPEGLYVIKSGECQVFTDTCTIRPKTASKYMPRRISVVPREPFRFGNPATAT